MPQLAPRLLRFRFLGLAQQALGIHAEHIPTGNGQEANRARARQAVMASIERGIPAFCSSEECSLLVGYDKNGETLLGRWYSSGDPGYVPMKDWPWAVEILRKEAVPDRRQAILRALRSAVDLARTEENQDGTYPSGFRALRLWAGWLRDQERMARETTDDKRFGTALGNAFILDCLIDARQAAAIFLCANAKRLGPDADAALLKAAQHCDEVTEQARAISPLAPWPWHITPEKPWTPAMMQQQADLVEALIPIEQAAIAEIEKALRISEVQAQAPAPLPAFGFRHDPMAYITQNASLPAALIRAQVVGTPLPGDAEIIAGRVAELLARQRPDGSFGDSASETGRHLDWRAGLGISADRPEFGRGFEAMLHQRDGCWSGTAGNCLRCRAMTAAWCGA